MKTFLVAVMLLCSLNGFSQELSPQNFVNGNVSEEDIKKYKEQVDRAYFIISNSIQMIEDEKIEGVNVQSALTEKEVALSEYASETQADANFKQTLEATLAKLLANDPKNWLPTYIRSLGHLADESRFLRDVSREEGKADLAEEDLKSWRVKNDRLVQIIQDVRSDNYIDQSGPGFIQFAKDFIASF